MRILVNALSARRGGIVTYTRNLMRSFKERDIDVLFALPQSGDFDIDVETMRLPVTDMMPLQRAAWEQLIWRRIVSREKPDILYSSANFGLLASPVPQVLLIREGGLFDPDYLANTAPGFGAGAVINRILRRRLILASARASDLILTPTDAMRDLIKLWSEDLGNRAKKNLYGTRVEHFTPLSPNQQKQSDATLRLLMVSAYYPHKQPGLVAEAVRLLNERGIKAHFTLTMDLAEISRVPAGAKDVFLLEKGVERGEITLLGRVDYQELPSLYHGHDAFVTASLSETFGHPLVEAMAAGIPVVASDTAVHREVCGDAALYFDPYTPPPLVDALTTLAEDSSVSHTLIEKGSSQSVEQYAWEAHVDRLLGHFEAVHNSRR